jgi:O-antigen/teichoic acid export membrane protein
MGYTNLALKGVTWIYAFRVFSRLITFLKIAIIARILSPSDFGVFGIATLILTFLEIITETGVNILLIQAKEDIKKYIDSAWIISIIRGTILFLIIFLLSPSISLFFNIERSKEIIMLIAFVPLIKGFINPAEVILQKNLNFKFEFYFRSLIFFADSLFSLILILITHSVYSLVAGLILGSILELILSFFLIKPTPRLKFNKEYLLKITSRGKWITAYGIFNYFSENGDNIMIGKLLGANSLGIYQMAYKISFLPISEMSDVINKVVFPVYTIISGDINRLKRAFYKTTILVTFFSTLIGLLIYYNSYSIINILLGEKWLATVSVLNILVFYGILRSFNGVLSSLFLSLNKQEYITVTTLIRCAILIFTIYPFILTFGMIGAAYSALLSILIEIPISIWLSYKILYK